MSMSITPPSMFRSVSLVSRGVMLETVRRKEFYVLLIMTLVFALGVLVMTFVGVENGSTGTFILNLGLTLAYFAAHLLALLSIARQVPNDINNRTLYPLLAKPLGRGQYLIGKWAACTLAGIITLALLTTLVWFTTPKMESYSVGVLLQGIVLHCISMGLITAIGLFFSLLVPQGVNIILGMLLFTFGEKIIGFIIAHASNTSFKSVAVWLTSYIPDFSKLNLIVRYTDGIAPLAFGEFFGLIVYGLLLTGIVLMGSCLIFNRQPL